MTFEHLVCTLMLQIRPRGSFNTAHFHMRWKSFLILHTMAQIHLRGPFNTANFPKRISSFAPPLQITYCLADHRCRSVSGFHTHMSYFAHRHCKSCPMLHITAAQVQHHMPPPTHHFVKPNRADVLAP